MEGEGWTDLELSLDARGLQMAEEFVEKAACSHRSCRVCVPGSKASGFASIDRGDRLM